MSTTDYSFDPVHEHLLASNVCPLDTEAASIRRLLTDVEAQMDSLNARIDVIQAAMDQLIGERDKLADRARQYRSVLSPVRRVPPELLCEILALVPCTRRIENFLADQPPWILAHICRRWRTIAIGCPSLWRSFTVVHAWTQQNLFYPRDMIETQLLRAASVPLSIRLCWWHDDAVGESSPLELLLPLSSRWESLRLESAHGSPVEPIFKFLEVTKGCLSQLVKVELLLGADPMPSDVECDLFSIAPRLSEFFVTDARRERYSPKLSIPWAQITRYCGVYSVARQLHILQNSPNLVYCSIGFDEEIKDTIHGNTMALLPLLRRLCVQQSGILAHITAPSLEHLLVADIEPAVIPFIQRSSCRLTTLVITQCSSVDGLVPFLAACPSLKHFVLDISDVNDPGDDPDIWFLFDALHLSHSPAPICPNLQSFALGLWDFDNFSEEIDAVFRMIQSRTVHPRRLRSVHLFCMDENKYPVPGEVKAGIRHLQNQGLDIKYLSTKGGGSFMTRMSMSI